MTTAIERFKMLFANAIERVCVLEEQLELARAQIEALEKEIEEKEKEDGGTETGDRAEDGKSCEGDQKAGS